MDKVLSDYIILEFKKQSGLDVQNDKKVMARIREAAEKVKIRLSNQTITDIILSFIAKDVKDLELSITRAKQV
jgi:molecular chaperone DnaK